MCRRRRAAGSRVAPDDGGDDRLRRNRPAAASVVARRTRVIAVAGAATGARLRLREQPHHVHRDRRATATSGRLEPRQRSLPQQVMNRPGADRRLAGVLQQQFEILTRPSRVTTACSAKSASSRSTTGLPMNSAGTCCGSSMRPSTDTGFSLQPGSASAEMSAAIDAGCSRITNRMNPSPDARHAIVATVAPSAGQTSRMSSNDARTRRPKARCRSTGIRAKRLRPTASGSDAACAWEAMSTASIEAGVSRHRRSAAQSRWRRWLDGDLPSTQLTVVVGLEHTRACAAGPSGHAAGSWRTARSGLAGGARRDLTVPSVTFSELRCPRSSDRRSHAARPPSVDRTAADPAPARAGRPVPSARARGRASRSVPATSP